MSSSTVTFVVLNWNGLDDTLVCLDSIRAQTISDYEIIVVDNGSALNQKEVLRTIKDIKLIDLPVNTGFTGGQLAAYEQAQGDYLALINNDAVIAPDWADQALKVFKTNARAAAVGGRAYLWNEDLGYDKFSTKNPFYSYQVVNMISGHTRSLMYGDESGSVNSISGSGVLIARSAIERVGYFDNQFFAYYEETDLFARFKRAGYEITYIPTMHTWHKIAQSTKSKPDFYLYHMHRNRFVYAIKNYDSHYLRAFLKFYFIEWVRAVIRVARHGRTNAREEKNLVKAGLRNFIRLPRLLSNRRKVQDLGEHYSSLLPHDLGESISVVIPCYNYGKYVGEAIDSVLAQTLKPTEIIVIDDGSTDDSLNIIEKYKDQVTVISQKNSGIIITKNLGLETAVGDWIVYLDADDKIEPEFLSALYRSARGFNADVAYSGMRFIGHEKGVFESRPFSRRSLRKGNYINNSSLMRREAVVSIGGYKEAMSFGYEDWELYIALAQANCRFRYVPEPLLNYRRHEAASRDIQAQEKLVHAQEKIRELHPLLFTWKYEFLDFWHGVLIFYRQRSLLQIVKDLRYAAVVRLDKLSEHSVIINKFLGFNRLLWSGKISKVFEKIGLNIKRMWKKIF